MHAPEKPTRRQTSRSLPAATSAFRSTIRNLRGFRGSVSLSTDRVYGVINKFKDNDNTLFRGVRIEIGEGENTVTVRFQERAVTAGMIEGVVNSLRAVLKEDQAPVAITISDGVEFENGFAVKEFAKIAGLDLKPGDLVQEA